MSKRKFGLILLVVFFFAGNLSRAVATEEYDLKASLVTRFPTYIEWPEKSDVHDELKPFVIGVIGKNPFGSALEEIQKKSAIKNKKIKIFYLSEAKEIAESGCHLLFISKTGKKKLPEIIAVTGYKPILTIADSKDSAEMGVHINVLVKDNKLRFEINRQAIKQSGLVIDYHLLQLAEKIID